MSHTVTADNVPKGFIDYVRANFITDILLSVSEIPDRDSPEDQPEMMLVTGDELKGIITSAFERMDERAAIQPADNVTLTKLHSQFIENHPDRMGFTGTDAELLAWGRRINATPTSVGIDTPEFEELMGEYLSATDGNASSYNAIVAYIYSRTVAPVAIQPAGDAVRDATDTELAIRVDVRNAALEEAAAKAENIRFGFPASPTERAFNTGIESAVKNIRALKGRQC